MAEESLCRRGLQLVPAVAAGVHWRLGQAVEPEELESLGRAALVRLVRGYEPGRAPFEAYLRPRLHWAMIDGVRRQTHGRTAAARARALFAAASLAGEEQGQARDEGGASSGIPPSERSHGQRLRAILCDNVGAMAIALIASAADPAVVADPGESPESTVLRRDTARALREAVDGLEDERQRALIRRHYFDDEPFGQIASDLEITRGWASKLHDRAIGQLAQKLSRRAVAPDRTAR